MEIKAWLRLMALALVVPLAVACAREDEETEADIEVETEPAAPAAPMTVQIQPMGGSALSGEVTATHAADQVNVRVSLNGVTEGEDYEAKLKYGTCTMAQAHFDAGQDITETTPGTPDTTHDVGDEFAEIELTATGTTATGTADIGTNELGPNEDAYISIEIDDDLGDDDRLLACADLRGHGDLGAPGAPSTTPGTPGAAMPSDSPGRY